MPVPISRNRTVGANSLGAVTPRYTFGVGTIKQSNTHRHTYDHAGDIMMRCAYTNAYTYTNVRVRVCFLD
jgi:hypothetical protein